MSPVFATKVCQAIRRVRVRRVKAHAGAPLVVAALLLCACGAEDSGPRAGPPNVVLILADDLGYGELGSYGQEKIHTPNLDRMAAEGVRFTRFYAGAAVCAPSRSVLMTGQHAGHTRIRGNPWPGEEGHHALLAEDVTLAELMKEAGYATAAIGKWGLGMPGSQGHPNAQGFDHFFGYLSQYHAHNYYPAFLWRNGEKVALPNVVEPVGASAADGAGVASEARVYAPDLFLREALTFVEENRERPFFLYYATNVPHSNNEASLRSRADGAEVPDLGPYADEPWELGARRHAAMITRMDADVGRILERLDALGVGDDTLVIFTSDNGPHRDDVSPPGFFDPHGLLRGNKGSLWEGGVRVPTVARWPARVPADRVSDHVAYFGDFLATFAELVGRPVPTPNDSISFLPALTGSPGQREHEWLYWELQVVGRGRAALLDGRWKGVLLPRRGFFLYDLEHDVKEKHDVAAEHPEITRRLRAYLETARTESASWPAP